MPLSVIGAGLGRTGTLSLKLALEQLGVGRCYHMMELFGKPEAPGRWLDAAEGRPVDWEAMFAGYSATVDWPSAAFYKTLADRYPDAKVILTLRDPDKWFESTQATILGPAYPKGGDEPWPVMIRKIVGGAFDGRVSDRAHVIETFNRHNAEVQRVIAPERLLVYEVSQGWEPLCDFLGLPVPATPMPATNSTQEFIDRLPSVPEAHAH